MKGVFVKEVQEPGRREHMMMIALPGFPSRRQTFWLVFSIAAGLLPCALGAFFYHYHDRHSLPAGTQIDRILVEKAVRRLSVFRDGEKLKSYPIALGRNPVGPKQEEGDMKTPEGVYRIDYHNSQSAFHLSLHISYPSPQDETRAAAGGVSPGSDIMIHGLPNGLGWIGAWELEPDWTAGCIALTDEAIEELWRITPDGTIVEIRP